MILIYIVILLMTSYILEIESVECRKTICNPRAGDLLIGRESFLRSSSTCGLSNSERYCVLTTSDSGRKSKCTICDSRNPYQKFSSTHSHRIENVVSRLPQDPNRWWQSVSGVHNVSIEISFESEFQFTFTHLRFKTYRPAAMYIERSKDYGRNWYPYAYFSDNCGRDFPSIPERKRSNINEVLCTSEFSSIIPSEGGTVLFSADTTDWVNNDVYWNKKRNDITAITNLRVQFVRLHTFGDWKVDDNPNIRNKYYYAISEWIIRGRCSCYGHASKCKAKEGQLLIKEMVYGVCECEHNTKGQHCEKCKDFYNDSPWLPADKNSTNECRKCECNSHSSSCHFDPVVYQQSGKRSGGVCDNCQHNTESKNCERCKSGYYRNTAVTINSPYTCLKCQCDSLGTKFPNICIQETETDRNLKAGNCMCKENVEGIYCEKCKIGFWKFNGNEETGCLKCNCIMLGTLENQGCDSSIGKCYCKSFVTNNDCSTCKIGYFNLSSSNPDGCSPCKCSEYGSVNSKTCDKYSGKCLCKLGFTGIKCDEIKSEWYVEKPRYPLKYLKEVKINLPPVSKSGYYNFIITTDTKDMQFYDTYVIFLVIDHIGTSSCKSHQDTMKLMKDSRHIVVPNKCLEKDLPITITVYTIEQPKDKISYPSIVDIIVVPLLDVNSTKTRNILGECLNYKHSEPSKKCDFLTAEISTNSVAKSDPLKCKCNVTGSLNNNCNKIGGQCQCLSNVSGKTCDRCAPESYGFDARGCKSCKCDLTGSLNSQCSNYTGKCLCREGVEGQHCDSCKLGYWNFPFCDPCKCNQMSATCDPKTGRCLSCKGNSFGFNCQHCENGYYGDTSRGIPCVKCQCPGLSTFRNNSIGCSLIFNTTKFTCMCKSGYVGQFCDRCDINHFGNAINQDSTCQPCRCSGNINNMIPNSCDAKTGECTKCLHNTAGFNCEKCVPEYFGNGVTRTCKKCVCNQMGTSTQWDGICDHETGKCPCLPNVVGLQCDRCQYNFYNISSRMGCFACECDKIGAVNNSCNQLTGQCYCHSGRSGKKCNNCKDGFWGDPTKMNGCKQCSCNPDGSSFKQCNRNNGVCRCKPGIAGRYCDKCRKGTDGKMPKCSSCGDCWMHWDDLISHNRIAIEKSYNSTITNIKFPKEINDICTSVDEYMKSLNEIEKYFPREYNIKGFGTKISILKNDFNKRSIIDINTKHYSIVAIENSTDYAKDMVSKNKIKDITGAYDEIRKSFKNILLGVKESQKLFKNINLMKEKLFYNKKELRYINFESIRMTTKELNDVLNEMSKNLNTFNGVTCNTKSENNPLKCSEFCGGVGCKPDMCYRHFSINKYCLTGNEFFNFYAMQLKNQQISCIFLKQLIEEIGIRVNSKEIKNAYVKPESEYNTTIKLIGVTNSTIEFRYLESVNLSIKWKKYINGSADLKDFESLIEKINKFELNFKEKEIVALEEQILSRKKKLNNVNRILDKSKFNRKHCNILKKSAIQAKEDTSFLHNSIKNVSSYNETTHKYEIIIKEFILNFTKILMVTKENLFKMLQNEKKAFQKQSNINHTIDKIKTYNDLISQILKEFPNVLQQIKVKQAFQKSELKILKKNATDFEIAKSINFKARNISKIKVSEEFQLLINKVHMLNKKIKSSQNKLETSKKLIPDKEQQLKSLSKDVDEKLGRLTFLQAKIYEKSEFHAQCLP